MSGAPLDMSLDDLIKSNKKSTGRGRGRGGGGPGPARRQPNRFENRAAPYAAPRAPDTAWSHDMFPAGGRASNIETGTKLYVSNLDYGVSNEDIKELFSEVGDLKRFTVHYDRSGRSKGTAEVVFSRRQDALAAIKRYNNVQLDGKPMKLELVVSNIGVAGIAPAGAAGIPSAGAFGDSDLAPARSGPWRGGAGRSRGGARGRGFGGRGRGRGRGRDDNSKVSAEDLDADLEKYHQEAMQTN